MSGKLGMEAKLYYKRGGVAAAGDWSECENVKDNKLSLSKALADFSTRGNNGWRAQKGGLKEASVAFQMIWDIDDADFDAFIDAFISGDVIGLAIMDGPIATGTGLVADFEVSKMDRDEGLENPMTADVECVITYSATAPQWYEEGATGTGTAP